MANALASKRMTFGEGGSAIVFVALALVSIVIAGKAYTPGYAFHAFLFSAASVAAVFAIFNRYYDRSAELPPLVLNGKPNYNMGPVKFATVASVIWGIAGFAVGLYIACELAFPSLNLDLAYITFGRLRPLHTSAVIFAFGGNVLIASSFYVVQRTCRARLVGDIAPWFVVLGYNFFIVIAGTGYLFGITQSKEYAQMIRPLRDEVERYGHYSLAAESMYDRPFQWGSKRTGPDLARVGGKYSDDWHRDHLRDPRSVVPGSVMPNYSWLEQTELDYEHIDQDLKVQAVLGVPYTPEMIANAKKDVQTQATADSPDAAELAKRYPKVNARDFDGDPRHVTEADALIAYLQMLGTLVDFKLYDDKANIR